MNVKFNKINISLVKQFEKRFDDINESQKQFDERLNAFNEQFNKQLSEVKEDFESKINECSTDTEGKYNSVCLLYTSRCV